MEALERVESRGLVEFLVLSEVMELAVFQELQELVVCQELVA
jgi:hypothetical protein